MAIPNFGLSMTAQNTHSVPTRNRPDKYAESPLAQRARFEVSEGVRPAEYFAPYRYLPVTQKDITTEDYVVIPKGRILSALSVFDLTPAGGIKGVNDSGVLYGFEDQVAGTTGSYSQDSSYFGYDEYITNLLVPANGGTDTTLQYTALDVAAGSYKADGTAAAAGDTFTNPANAPIGVAYHDWYQDIRGKWLNYRMWPDGGHVLTDWYVEVPFVKASGTFARGLAGDSVATRNAFSAVSNVHSYLTINDTTEELKSGTFVKSDALGNWMPEAIASAQLSQGKTVQTVGKVIGIDTRYPKSGLEDVQTYPGSRMPGTQTAGLPSFLFEFVVATEIAKGNTPTIESVLASVQAGNYGVARIQVLVS